MKVEEKDRQIQGLLEEEAKRCRDVMAALAVKLAQLPRGSLNLRKKSYKGKQYLYYYLVAREGAKVINKHIPDSELPELQKNLEQRVKCWSEFLLYKKRLAYLDKLLHKSQPNTRRQ